MNDRLLNFFTKLIEGTLFILLAMIVLMVLMQVISRYIVHEYFQGIEELARLAFVWACFLGIGLGVIKNEHVAVDILTAKIPKRFSTFQKLFLLVMIEVVSIIMIVEGIRLTLHVWTFPDYSTALFYPRSLFYLPVPITGLIIFIHTTGQLFIRKKQMS